MVPSRQSGVNCTINLLSLELNGNGLSGELPGELFNLKKMQLLSLGNQYGQGRVCNKTVELSSTLIIEWVEFHTKGVELWSDRCIRRPRYHKLPMLKGLHLHTNSFEGELPENIGDLRYLRYLWLE